MTEDGHVFLRYYNSLVDWIEVASGVRQAVTLWQGDGLGASGEHWYTCGLAFLEEDGNVRILVLGDDSSKQVDDGLYRKQEESARQAETWSNVVQIVGWNGTLYGLHADGTVSTTDPKMQETMASYTGITKLVERNWEILGIREDGTVAVIVRSENAVAFGRTQADRWSDIRDIAMGGSHVAGLKKDGTVVAAGSNHEGQCDVEDWTDIVYLTAGRNCTIGITDDGQIKMAGYLY